MSDEEEVEDVPPPQQEPEPEAPKEPTFNINEENCYELTGEQNDYLKELMDDVPIELPAVKDVLNI